MLCSLSFLFLLLCSCFSSFLFKLRHKFKHLFFQTIEWLNSEKTKWIDEIKLAELKSHEQASLDEILLGDEIEKLSIADAGLKQSEVVFFD